MESKIPHSGMQKRTEQGQSPSTLPPSQKLVPRPWNEERQAIPYSPLVRVACGQLASREPSLKEELTPINFQPLPTVVDSRL